MLEQGTIGAEGVFSEQNLLILIAGGIETLVNTPAAAEEVHMPWRIISGPKGWPLVLPRYRALDRGHSQDTIALPYMAVGFGRVLTFEISVTCNKEGWWRCEFGVGVHDVSFRARVIAKLSRSFLPRSSMVLPEGGFHTEGHGEELLSMEVGVIQTIIRYLQTLLNGGLYNLVEVPK